MNLDEKKSQILWALKAELEKLGIPLEERDIRVSSVGSTWAVWIERKDGSNTSKHKFLVDLGELDEGVDYVTAAVYRARRWSLLLGRQNPGGPAAGAGLGNRLAPILVAEDDPDDRAFIQKALKANHVKNPVSAVFDGEQLLDYLYRRGPFSAGGGAPAPCLILLDLNMPRIDGREALRIIKGDPALRKIPVVIFTTSLAPEDVLDGYENGANSYVTKPASAEGFVKSIEKLQDYWLNLVQLPPRAGAY